MNSLFEILNKLLKTITKFALKNTVVIHCLVLITLTWTVYGNNIGNEFVNFDDYSNVVNKRQIMVDDIRGLIKTFIRPQKDVFYFPVKISSFILSYKIRGGFDPSAFHFTNDLIHILAVLACYMLVFCLTRDARAAFVLSAVFAVHPLQGSVVNHISSRGHLLAGLFIFMTLSFYTLSVYRRDREETRAAGHWWFFGALFSFALGLMSFSTPILLPFAVFIYHCCENSNSASIKSRMGDVLARLWPFFLMSFTYFAANIYLFHNKHNMAYAWDLYGLSYFYQWPIFLYQYILNSVIISPHPYAQLVKLPPLSDFGYYFYRISFVAVLVWLVIRLKRSANRGSFAAALFFFGVAPALITMYPDQQIQLRYLYWPSAGLYLLIYLFFKELDKFLSGRFGINFTLVWYAVFAVLIVSLSMYGHQRNRVWRTSRDLYGSAARIDGPLRVDGLVWGSYAQFWNGDKDDSLASLEEAKKVLDNLPAGDYSRFKQYYSKHIDRLAGHYTNLSK